MIKTNVFVYGTLMRGEGAHSYLAKAEFVGEYRLPDYAIYDLGWYPGIRPKKGSVVYGEVYAVDDRMLAEMDRYEGEGSLYHRTPVVVENETGTVNAVAYVYAKEIKGREIEGGRWNHGDH